MQRPFLLALVLLLVAQAAPAMAPADAPGLAAERDILDAALEHPLGDTFSNGQPVRFGDLGLDTAEAALRSYLPRPWTATRIHALFQAAYTRLGEARKQADTQAIEARKRKEANNSSPDQGTDERAARMKLDEWEMLVQQLGVILAASRDPRAALALERVIESPDPLVLPCRLARTFMTYFLADTSYRDPAASQAAEAPVTSYTIGCIWSELAHGWWLLNQREVEQRAAAITASLAPCPKCEQEALAAVDQLRTRIHDSALAAQARMPTLRLTIEGAGTPRYISVSYALRSTSGEWGRATDGGTTPYTSPDYPLRISGEMLDRSDMQLSGVVISTGYKSVRFELDRINDGRVVPIKLVQLPGKTLTGTATISSDAAPRPFRLVAHLRDVGTSHPSGAQSRGGMLLQSLAEGTVDEDGRFSITVPDYTQDPILNIPGNHYELAARNSDWVAAPDFVALDHPPGTPLKIVVTPRPGTAASANK